MDVFEAISRRRSIRKYKTTPVEEEKLDKYWKQPGLRHQQLTDRNGNSWW